MLNMCYVVEIQKSFTYRYGKWISPVILESNLRIPRRVGEEWMYCIIVCKSDNSWSK
jgi:hypothetical protein